MKISKLKKASSNFLDHIYLIGETAYNHEGDINYLKGMIGQLAQTGADAIKFHMLLNIDSYISINHPVYDIIKDWIFTKEEWKDLIKYSKKNNLEVIVLTDDIDSINYIKQEALPVDGIEIHSTGLNDYYMLKALQGYEGVILLGVGGTSINEIILSTNMIKNQGNHDIVLMYGFQKYPTDYRKINLNKMQKFQAMFDLPVGYADHTRFDDPNNLYITSLGVTKGANIIEKHFTLDEGKDRVDYQAAIDCGRLVDLIKLLDISYQTLGNGNIDMTEDEKEYGIVGPMKKAIVAKQEIQKGTILDFLHLTYKRTQEESDLTQSDIYKIIGKRTTKMINKDEVISLNNLEN